MNIIEKDADCLTVRLTHEEARGLVYGVKIWDEEYAAPNNPNLARAVLAALALQDAMGETPNKSGGAFGKEGFIYDRAVYEKALGESPTTLTTEPTPSAETLTVDLTLNEARTVATALLDRGRRQKRNASKRAAGITLVKVGGRISEARLAQEKANKKLERSRARIAAAIDGLPIP